ncbi:MAG: cytochrome P450 [Cyanophyceae cyanobacterium]
MMQSKKEITAASQWSVPGPRPLPLIGRMLNSLQFAQDSIGYSSQLFQEYGSVASLAAGGGTNLYSSDAHCPGSVVAYGPEVVRQVTLQHNIYHKHPLTGRLYRLKDASPRTEPLRRFTVGLFGVNEDTHLQHRKLMMPAFHQQKINSYRNAMVAIVQSELNRVSRNQVLELNQFMQRLTLRIATKTLFGEDIETTDLTAGEILQQILNRRATGLTLDIPGLSFHQYLNLLAQFEEKIRKIIADKRTTDEDDLLSMLLQARDEDSGLTLTEDEIIGHTGVIFAAGHETTANALTWLFFLLSQHPSVAADLVDELSILNGAPPSVEQLQHLPLLERAIKEAMRVLPSVPWNGRVVAQATELEGYPLAKGTEVFVSIYHTHHLSTIYADPQSFKPERWETITPNNYEYNPFSAGPRTCIGAAFAMMEIKLVVAMMLQRFRLEFLPQRPVVRSGFISIKPKFGLPMMVHQQDRQFHRGVGGVTGNIREMVDLPQ